MTESAEQRAQREQQEQKEYMEQLSLPPITTAEEDRTSLSFRNINFLWEATQAFIAIGVTMAAMYSFIAGINSDNLENAAFVVLGFYFGRTNHSRPHTRAPRLQ